MSLPNVVSFVGVDEKINICDLLEVQNLNSYPQNSFEPVIEWGVLYSPQRAGRQNRYPTLKFIEKFLDDGSNPGAFRKSLHLCGAAVDEYLNSSTSTLHDLIEYGYCRVQLNFSMAKYDQDDLIRKISEKAIKHKHQLIIQHNKSKKKFVEKLSAHLEETTNTAGYVDFLYDGSGGFGREIENIDPIIPYYYTGYAGGLNPENVEEVVRKIHNVNDNASIGFGLYYIDMESGVRTDNWFDLNKCASILHTLKKLPDKLKAERIFE